MSTHEKSASRRIYTEPLACPLETSLTVRPREAELDDVTESALASIRDIRDPQTLPRA